MRELRIGIILSYLTIFITNITGLFATSLIVKNLPISDYGIYILAGSLVAYLGVLDAGITNSTARFIAKYKELEGKAGGGNFVGFIFKNVLILAFFISCLSWLIYFSFDYFLSKTINTQQIGLLKDIWFFSVSILILSVFNNFVIGYSAGNEKFIFNRLVIIIKCLVRVLAIYLIFNNIPSVIILLKIDLVIMVVVLFFNFFYTYFFLKMRLHFRAIERVKKVELYQYSSWILVFLLATQLQWQSGQIIAAKYLSSDASAIYGVGVMLGTYYGAFASAISGVFLARATKMAYQKGISANEINEITARIGKLILMVLLPILGGFILFGKSFISLWIGDAFQQSWDIALLIMIGYTIPLITAFASQFAEGKGLFRYRSLLYLISALIGIVSSIFLLKNISVLGLGFGIFIGLCVNSILLIFYYHFIIKVNMILFFNKIRILVIPALLSVLIGRFLMSVIAVYDFNASHTWYGLMLSGIIYILIYLLMIFLFSFSKDEKKAIINNFKY